MVSFGHANFVIEVSKCFPVDMRVNAWMVFFSMDWKKILDFFFSIINWKKNTIYDSIMNDTTYGYSMHLNII